MLKRNKAIAIAIAFVFCMSFIAPALIAPSVAQAAVVDYSFSGSGKIVNSSTPQDIGTLVVSVSEATLLDTYASDKQYLSITLPSGMEFAADPTVTTANGRANATVTKTGVGTKTVTFKVWSTGAGGTEKIMFKLGSVTVKDASGDVSLSVAGPAGSIFPKTDVTIGEAVSSGSTTTTVKSVKTFGDGTGTIDDIIIEENTPNTLQSTDQISLQLDPGYEWVTGGTVSGEWGLAGKTGSASAVPNGRKNTISLTGLTPTSNTAGRIVLSGAQIKNTKSDKTGEVSVSITGTGDITSIDLVIAKYGSYGVTLSEDTVKEVTAGKTDVKIGSFILQEDIKGSLIGGRTVTLDLPSGVKWVAAPKISVKKGADRFAGTGGIKPATASNSGKTLKYTVNTLADSASKLLFEGAKVYIEPGFEGPIEITVSGTAGAEGTVKVAEVKPAITIKAEGVKDVVVGSQNQKVADILIVENDKGAILDASTNNQIVVSLDTGYKFYKKPVVEVTEGNLEIDSVKLNSDSNQLTIKIKYESTQASTIKLSDVYLTGFRSAPEGPVKAILVEVDSAGNGSTALDEGYDDAFHGGTGVIKFSEASAGDVVIANCVTPANSGANISFKVSSNIYTVNGVNKVMDAAPYIKGDRTYVPMRYMAETLGAEVVWDQTAQTVTLTKGDTVVVFTIGSTTYTVNGESAVADVAPEITSDRTMLPARYAAEALGAVVGWDAATQTVIINQ
jgi:hypothetical protein